MYQTLMTGLASAFIQKKRAKDCAHPDNPDFFKYADVYYENKAI